MSDPTVTPVIGVTAAFVIPFGIAWLANWYGRAVARKRWEEFCDRTDQQYADCLNTVPESYSEALEMVAANSDKPIAQFTKWPEITEEQVINLYHKG